jgi:hypothetical protein
MLLNMTGCSFYWNRQPQKKSRQQCAQGQGKKGSLFHNIGFFVLWYVHLRRPKLGLFVKTALSKCTIFANKGQEIQAMIEISTDPKQFQQASGMGGCESCRLNCTRCRYKEVHIRTSICLMLNICLCTLLGISRDRCAHMEGLVDMHSSVAKKPFQA